MIDKRQVRSLRNIPIFTTEFGVASLILESVAARKEAYVRIQSSLQPEKLIEECVSFCKACGAERVYATGHEILASYPLHTSILQMNADRTISCLVVDTLRIRQSIHTNFPMILWRILGMGVVDSSYDFNQTCVSGR